MAHSRPVFKYRPGLSDPNISETGEAKAVVKQNKQRKDVKPPLSRAETRMEAIEDIRRLGGDVNDETTVLAFTKIQFGQFEGMSFRWLLENSLGYAAYIVDGMKNETEDRKDPRSANKFALKSYFEMFPECHRAMEIRQNRVRGPSITPPLQRSLVSIANDPRVSPQKAEAIVKKRMKAMDSSSDEDIVKGVENIEKSGKQQPSVANLLLPEGWKGTLPESDHWWVSALFKKSRFGSAEMDFEKVNHMWCFPPPTPLAVHQVPRPDRYFSRPLFLWFPRRFWKIQLFCPHSGCEKQELMSAGIYPRVRQVMDVDGWYSMAAEYLECRSCKRKVISWNFNVVSQLDVPHQVEFPCVMTYQLACDKKVLRLLRQRGVGNSTTQIQKKLSEQHHEVWLERVVRYLGECDGFAQFQRRAAPGHPFTFYTHPVQREVPTSKWLLRVYVGDVLMRLEEVKAAITSVFGDILKMDSTKKVTKKLAGHASGTAIWATNVGNEYGQVLNCVLTSGEGFGLGPLISGVMGRYREASVSPPRLLYVDRDCCGSSTMKTLFAEWPQMEIRLDIWHFMRRISAGCSTDSHQLYGVFMSRLSQCIFEWSSEDLEQLKLAKRGEFQKASLQELTEKDVIHRINAKELALHCRRTTRGEEATRELISQLIMTFSGDQGRDTMGVPLIDTHRMDAIWTSQLKHVKCIQDPPGVSLYKKTGEVTKGGVRLNTYRCARGSTSLESFHLHLATFIPGKSANDLHFQAYILEGLRRWNEDRAKAANIGERSEKIPTRSYSGLLQHAANTLGMSVHGQPIFPSYNRPKKYTGEHIGVEYLYQQTGKVLQDYKDEIDTAVTVEDEEDDHLDMDMVPEDDPTLAPLVATSPVVRQSTGTHTSTPVQPSTSPSIKPVELAPTPRVTPVLRIPDQSEYEVYTRASLDTSISQGPQRIPQQPPTPRLPMRSQSPVRHPSPMRSPVRHPSPMRSPSPMTFHYARSPSPVRTPSPVRSPSSVRSEPSPMKTFSTSRSSSSARSLSPTRSSSPSPVRPTSAPPEYQTDSSDSDDSVGPDNVGGYDKVQELADFLIQRRDEHSLSGAQAILLTRKWRFLDDFDKQPTTFSPRHRSRLTSGRFKAKATGVVPGVDSTRRCFLGQNTGPAQWPDCNRYVEAIVSRLCELYPGNERTPQGSIIMRWTLISRAYNKIRQLVLNNARVMENTELQLPEINNTTLSQWYNRRAKKQERQVLQQGITLTPPPMTASQVLPPPSQSQPDMASSHGDQHMFDLPINKAGMASTRKKATKERDSRPLVSKTYGLKLPDGSVRILQLPGNIVDISSPPPSAAAAISSQSPLAPQAPPLAPLAPLTSVQHPPPPFDFTSHPLPYSTYRNRKRKGAPVRDYHRQTQVIKCGKCGGDRSGPDHHLYFMNVYCAKTDGVSLEAWKATMKVKYRNQRRRRSSHQ